MARPKYQSIERVAEAARLLGALAREVVFAGGSATGLLLTDPAIADVRPTLDIDVILEAASLGDYYRFQEQLRNQGFREDTESDVICRWRHGHIILDVMPTDRSILGFANRWYAEAAAQSRTITLGDVTVNVVTPAYFLATKLEAFHGRGNRDYMASHDMEDIVAVIDGRMEIVEDVEHAPENVRAYLADQFSALLDDEEFVEAITGHLPPDAASQRRAAIIIARMDHLAGRRSPSS